MFPQPLQPFHNTLFCRTGRVAESWLAGAVLYLLLASNSSSAIAWGSDFSHRDPFYARLAAPMTSMVDGKSFRAAIESIAQQADLNVWIDRRVDPTTPIMAGPVGPTVFSAIEKVASQRQCVLMPVANVLIVGRPKWVDQTTDSVLSLTRGNSSAPTTVEWDELTNPHEAVAIAAGTETTIIPELPHDLWPAVRWNQVDRRVAVMLILAQFDRRVESTKSLARIKTSNAKRADTIVRRYAFGEHSDVFRREFVKAGGRVRSAKDWIVASGSTAAHRAGVTSVYSALAETVVARAPDVQFTVKEIRTSADIAFRQLATMAGTTCVIDPSASENCKGTISIKGENLTLRQLIDRVAQQAGVVATWTNQGIVITSKKRPR